ncbi:MAG TPA: S4 domain-containing protein [Thermoanaerobaculia bacterium]|nr:S4 domain-containing protein [Thermoanaerobaculia bacterium]
MVAPEPNDRHRIDTWLKLVCLFKHRADATEACKGGHVKINGQRVKPAAPVKVGDLVEFYQADRFRRVVVEALPLGNVSKETARTMYLDESPVQEKPDILTQVYRDRGTGRPTKKDRRDIEKARR